jgi:hypothetical protein
MTTGKLELKSNDFFVFFLPSTSSMSADGDACEEKVGADQQQFESLAPLLERKGPFEPLAFIADASENLAELASVRCCMT